MPLQPGQIIDRYVIESMLGAGGMGEVYRARDTRLQRSVALKVLHDVAADVTASSGSNPSAGGAERLLREARAAAALEHANVVAVYDVGHVAAPGNPEGVTYLAMELIKGRSLRTYVGDATVPMSERLRWLVDVARALSAAHRAGVVHRDVKPENVMIRDDGAVKVLDFGIARRSSSMVDPTSSTAGQSLATMTARGVVVGTPQYMAPEQLRADSLDGRADQFAWGVVAYELLTGRPPWKLDEGAIALVAQILSHEPPPVDALAEVPEHVTLVIKRALRKDREARFPSMQVVVDALEGKVNAFASTIASVPPQPPGGAAVSAPPTREAEAFASAPTQAVMTPPPSRRGSTAPPAEPPRSRAASRFAVAAVALVLAGTALGVGVKLRSRGAADKTHAPSATAAGCPSNKACVDAHGGEPWVCRASDHQCVSLESEDCKVLADPGDVALDSTVWLGALRSDGDLSEPILQTFQLARRDFAETVGTLGDARHIAMVSCSTSADSTSADVQRAARHLADDIGVPAALVTLTLPSDIIEVASQIFGPKEVLVVLPLSASPLVTALPPGPSGRLVYRSTYSVDSLLAPTAGLVESVLLPRLSPPGSNASSGHVRIAFLHNKGISASVFFDRMLTMLTFNGKSVIDNGDDFRDVAYDNDAASYDAAFRELAAFRPDIVLARVSAGAVHGVIEPLEKRSPGTTRAPAPTYVLSQPLSPEVLDLVAGDPSRRQRFFGMDAVSSTVANVQYVNHYNQTFNASATRVDAQGTCYDGFYALAYAIHALGRQPVSGPAIAGAFRRLAGPGRKVLVGPQPIFEAYRDLVAGANIDLEGTAGHLDLDPSTGESACPISILCAEPPTRGSVAHARESGLVYDDEVHGFVGSLACP